MHKEGNQNYTDELELSVYITMLFIQDMLGVCGLYSLSRAPRTGNENQPTTKNEKKKERYSTERIPGSDICLTLVHLKSNLL